MLSQMIQKLKEDWDTTDKWVSMLLIQKCPGGKDWLSGSALGTDKDTAVAARPPEQEPGPTSFTRGMISNTCMNRNKTRDRESGGLGLCISVDHFSLQWERLYIRHGTLIFGQFSYIIHYYKLLLCALILQPVSWHWHAR